MLIHVSEKEVGARPLTTEKQWGCTRHIQMLINKSNLTRRQGSSVIVESRLEKQKETQ